MGFLNKMMGMGTAKSEEAKKQITEIFQSQVVNGESYSTIAGFYLLTTKKLLKEVRTYYNYIVGYKDGEDPEIVILAVSSDLSSADTPVVCKKSQCQKAEYRAKTGEFYIQHPSLENGEVIFGIIVSTAWDGYLIDVSYVDEFTPFAEFFENRFSI